MIATKPIAAPDTPEWHSIRSRGIGASEAAAACGLSRWELPLEVWSRKVYGDSKEETDAMWLGTQMEPIVAAMFERKTGHRLRKLSPGLYRHPEHDWMLSTPDGLVDDDTLAEFKTTTSRNGEIGAEDTDEVPIEWLCQAQQQMACTGAKAVRIGVLIDGREFKEFVVDRHTKLIERLIVREGELWRHVESKTPPPLDFSSQHATRALADAFRYVAEGEAIELDPAMEDRWKLHQELSEQIKERERMRDEIKAEVLMRLQFAQRGLFPSGASVNRCIVRETVVPEHTRKSYVRLTYRKGK